MQLDASQLVPLLHESHATAITSTAAPARTAFEKEVFMDAR